MASSTTGGRRGPYAGTAERRRAILESAFEVFSESGYRGGSMRDIAQRIGIAHTTLLHHFSSKSELLAGVLQLRDEHDHPDLAENGVVMLRQLVAVVRRNQGTPGLTELYCILSAEATAPDHPAHDWFQERYVRTVGSVQQALARMAEAGELVEGMDPALEARRIVALMDGLQLQWLLDRDAIDMAAQIHDYLQRLSIPKL